MVTFLQEIKWHHSLCQHLIVSNKKMQEFVTEESKNMVFSEDLKNMVHLAEKQDLPLVIKIMEKYILQSNELKFGNYIFGPVVMRMFYHLEDIDTALQCFKDNKFAEFFNQMISYQLLLDLLYNNGRYQDVLDVFEIMKERRTGNNFYPKFSMVLVYAALYKINTKQSLDYGLKIWQTMMELDQAPMRRSATFMAGLALAQNSAHIALEILCTSSQQNYITVRNMKILAMLELNRIEDVVPILRSALEINPSRFPTNKHTFCKEVLDKVIEAMNKIDNKELKLDFDRIVKFLNENGHIDNQTIDNLLCSEIITSTGSNASQGQSKDQTFLNASFSRDRNTNRQSRPFNRNRPGLAEMY